jgi:hypothetical protein
LELWQREFVDGGTPAINETQIGSLVRGTAKA